MSERWSPTLTFSTDYKIISKHKKFEAENVHDAKLKILDICKKAVFRRRHSTSWNFFMVHAMPYLDDT